MLVLGLAPAAHGGNRTGRIFTGDRSGDWLFASLYRTGFANQPTSVSRDDGLRLTRRYVAAAVRCAPPANRPPPAERDNCLPYLVRELAAARVGAGDRGARVVRRGTRRCGRSPALGEPRSRAPAEVRPRRRRVEVGRFTLLGCYHPSQQNTFTGKLTEPMIDEVFGRAKELAG